MSNVEIQTQVVNIIADYRPTLKAGVSVMDSTIESGDEKVLKIEIRNENGLIWRAWSLESNFLFDLKRNLQEQQDPELAGIPLTTDEVLDLYNYVVQNGKSTESSIPPNSPDNAEELNILTKGPDIYTVWLVDGWPVMATDELCLCSWVM